MAAILAKELSPLSEDIPKARDELQQIVTKALRKDPSQRYQSANEMLDALKALRRKLELDADLKSRGSETASHPWLRWTTSPTAVALASLLGALALALPFYWLRNPTANLMPEKSIAVLPFENLSPDQDNAFFADGVQADILTKLAKVADLKVISRTSVMRYRGKQDMREIGRALGVSHLLEGTVRRSNGSVRINAQLIDARTDTHVWAEEYDRDLNEVFAIEAELAQAVADKLKAMISAPEKLALQDRPTKDLVAYDLYCDARQLALTISYGSDVGAKLLQAIDLLDQAVARDPSFFDAYCLLASAHNEIYFIGDDHSPGRLALAEKAVTAAARLRPDAGETHLARAENLYKGHLDYDNALAELEIARQTLPNNPRVSELQGYVERRRGRWDAAMQSLQRAADLDPRNIDILHQIALNSDHLRRYAHVKQALDRALAIDPNDLQTRAARAVLEYDWKADTRPLQQLIDEIRAKDPGSIRSIADGWLACALAERNPVAAQDALIAAGEDMPFNNQAVHFSHDFMKGVVARMKKDQNEAQTAFTAARIDQEKALKDQPEYAPAICVLGLIDAALGRHDDALREGRRAVALLPVEKDPINGALMIEYLAMIAAWAGNNDLAVEQLTIAIRLPGSLSYGQLKLDPSWDPLRGDPRFEQIVNSLAPK
jgi:serine/threonine-protein kinase